MIEGIEQPPQPQVHATGASRFISQDMWSGLLVAAFAAAAIVESRNFAPVAGEIGPEFFPFWIGVILAIFAALLLVNALRGRSVLGERPALRPLFFSMAGILSFAIVTPLLGGLAAMIAVVTLVALSEPGRTLRELVLLNLFIVVPAWLIFVVGLSVQLPMF